jgi:hypothetical protein
MSKLSNAIGKRREHWRVAIKDRGASVEARRFICRSIVEGN